MISLVITWNFVGVPQIFFASSKPIYAYFQIIFNNEHWEFHEKL